MRLETFKIQILAAALLGGLFLSVGASADKASLSQPDIKLYEGQLGALELGADVTQALRKFNSSFSVYDIKDYIPSIRNLYITAAQPKGKKLDCEKSPPPPMKALPMAVVGDFNGDGKRDVVVMGTDKRHHYVLGVLSGKDYSVKVIERADYVPPSESYYPPLFEGEESSSKIKREQGLTVSMALVESEDKARKVPYYVKCLGPDIKRFEDDGVLVSEYMSSDNRLYYEENGRFYRFKPE